MNEIVKYHNDLNKLKIPSFSELEQNLLFGMLLKVKNNDKCEFSANELRTFISDKNPTNAELFKYIDTLGDKFFKADFTEIKKIDEREYSKTTYNLFKDYTLYYKENENEKELTRLQIEINEIFAYLVHNLTANFTRFELAEFISLSGKYTKTLYRLLKQYRTTGSRIFEWQEFSELLDIPKDYRQIDIDARILKPAIKELTKVRNLFDQERIPFENLTYTKLDKNKKPNPRGRNKVCFIKFDWKKQEIEVIENNTPKQESEIEKTNIKQNHKKSPNLNAYAGIHLENITTNMGSVSGKILSVCEVEGGFVMSFLLDNGEIKTIDFDSQEKLEECVNKFQI